MLVAWAGLHWIAQRCTHPTYKVWFSHIHPQSTVTSFSEQLNHLNLSEPLHVENGKERVRENHVFQQ